MNLLLLGSGGREHALAWKLSQSKLLTKLFIAPGNAGTSQCGTNININPLDFTAVKNTVLQHDIHMLIVGPEDPLVKGIHDFFLADDELKNIPVIGPTAKGAMLEGSKDFSKQFMQRHHIPTARYKTITKDNLPEGFAFLETLQSPYVLKADGLAAGKGVLILNDLAVAKQELQSLITEARFGASNEKVVIEEFLTGIELSVFVLTDGVSYKTLPAAKDYKRIGNNDTGLNTGGMGAVSPVPFATDDFMQNVENKIIKPTIEGLKKENIDYRGFIFIGLINVNNEPFVIEYNCRLGDPETEVVIPRIKSDLLQLFIAVSRQKLSECTIEIDSQFATTVMLVSGGYPNDYEKGKIISGLDVPTNSLVFHAGTVQKENNVVTNGGRVIAVTSLAPKMKDALRASYQSLQNIVYENIYYRNDIGNDLEKYLND